ncbi:hypothetical protein Fmac_013574 [Flemingia macrophylla]|uniref:Glycosyltransferase n=1 Tax=Flemingia macrophylla TaxID=520843 RepID=A0ABD1MTJ0_9FABA
MPTSTSKSDELHALKATPNILHSQLITISFSMQGSSLVSHLEEKSNYEVCCVMEEAEPLTLHFVHFLAAGHMIPLCDIATLFASRGHNVTIITTPSNAQISASRSPTTPSSNSTPSTSPPKRPRTSPRCSRPPPCSRPPIEQYVEEHPPNCIIADFLFPLGILRLAFNGFSLFATCAVISPHEASDDNSCLLLPTLPHPITINAIPPEELTEFLNTKLKTGLKSHGLIVNSFAELNGHEYIRHYGKTTSHKAWHLGPASLICRSPQQKADRGQTSVVSMHHCLTWLDSKPLHSVVYVCFGSLCHFPDNQLYEIACGIEASGHDFIWVVPEKKGKEKETQWLPNAFEERNEKKGMIIKGWVPQLLILNHRAVGAFVTHCGWNSTVEAVSAGIPMVTWPVHGEQFYNEKLISEVRGLGVEVGATEWSTIGFGERHKLVSRDAVENAVRRLMDGGDEAREIRRRAHEFGEKAREAVEEGGSSHNNLTALIHD